MGSEMCIRDSHYIDPGIDTGEIIGHVQVPIYIGDTPHSIGNNVIRDSIRDITRVFQALEENDLSSVPQWKADIEHSYRRRDFNAEILQDLLRRWDEGLVSRFLEKIDSGRIEQVRIIPISAQISSSDRFRDGLTK